MNIKETPSINQFINRCLINLENEHKNDFIDLYVDKNNEDTIKGLMKKAGFADFMVPKDQWPSLFIKTNEHLNSYYHKNINLEMINEPPFKIKYQTIKANYLFNNDTIKPDLNRELNDYMILRALDEDYQALFLYQNDKVWMIDAPSENNTIDPISKKAQGNILTFGLGIGYYVCMACLNPTVRSITVIERSKEVINMFNKHILPQIPNNQIVRIINDDAFNFYNKDNIDRFDHVFVDIYQSNNDGLKIIEKLLMKYNPSINKLDFWIEYSCFEILPTLILLYYCQLLDRRSHSSLIKNYQKIFNKINKYFSLIDETIEDVGQLKTYMYDIKILRDVLAQR